MSKEKEHDLELVVARSFGMPWMARKENPKLPYHHGGLHVAGQIQVAYFSYFLPDLSNYWVIPEYHVVFLVLQIKNHQCKIWVARCLPTT